MSSKEIHLIQDTYFSQIQTSVFKVHYMIMLSVCILVTEIKSNSINQTFSFMLMTETNLIRVPITFYNIKRWEENFNKLVLFKIADPLINYFILRYFK